MALNEEQLAILKTELASDPEALGYTTDDPDCADLLNEIHAAYQIPNTSISVADVLLAIDPDEAATIHVNKMQLFSLLMSDSLNMSENSDLEISVRNIFTGCTDTLSALADLRTRAGSRAEVVFEFPGISVNYLDVSRARLSGQGY